MAKHEQRIRKSNLFFRARCAIWVDVGVVVVNVDGAIAAAAAAVYFTMWSESIYAYVAWQRIDRNIKNQYFF